MSNHAAMAPPKIFDSPRHADLFARELRTRAVGKTIHYCARTHSTNDLALQAARLAQGAAHGMVFVADEQDGGRGRRGRSWQCPPGLGLLFSVIVRPEELSLPPAECGWIPLAAGLAMAEGLSRACELSVTFKWPNDVVLPCVQPPGWKKLGGILCESQLQAAPHPTLSPKERGETEATGGYVVVGIGLNLNQNCENFPPEIAGAASSILIETGRLCVRRAVFAAVLEALDARLRQFADAASRQTLKEAIEQRQRAWWTEQHELQLRSPAGDESAAVQRGEFAGLDGFGRLKLHESGGGEAVFADAEILEVARRS